MTAWATRICPDVKADVIEIGDTQFGIFYLDAMEHPDRYDGKTIRAKGHAFRMKGIPKNTFVFGRHAMTCCVNDIGGIGYLCAYTGKLPDEKAWFTLTAKVEAGYSAIHERDAVILVAQDMEAAVPPEEEIVYFN